MRLQAQVVRAAVVLPLQAWRRAARGSSIDIP